MAQFVVLSRLKVRPSSHSCCWLKQCARFSVLPWSQGRTRSVRTCSLVLGITVLKDESRHPQLDSLWSHITFFFRSVLSRKRYVCKVLDDLNAHVLRVLSCSC